MLLNKTLLNDGLWRNTLYTTEVKLDLYHIKGLDKIMETLRN
jgi:hypothetical protein